MGSHKGSAFAAALSVGRFDGKAVTRVRQALLDPAAHRPPLDFSDHAFLFDADPQPGQARGTLGASSEPSPNKRHTLDMLGFRAIIVPATRHDAARVDVFARFDSESPDMARSIEQYANELRRPRLMVEDGLVGLPAFQSSPLPSLSILIDDKAPYFDASQATRLEDTLNDEWELSNTQRQRCEELVARFVDSRLSRFAYASDNPLDLPEHSVLVVDQRTRDRALTGNPSAAQAFEQMLQAALDDNPGATVVVKLDFPSEGEESFLHQLAHDKSVRVVAPGANPHAVFDRCHSVYTVCSSLGFEALMRNRQVRCFGMPFYAGWGLTDDWQSCARRSRRRRLEDVFYAAYLLHSRYYRPDLGRTCNIEEVLTYLASLHSKPAQTTPVQPVTQA